MAVGMESAMQALVQVDGGWEGGDLNLFIFLIILLKTQCVPLVR